MEIADALESSPAAALYLAGDVLQGRRPWALGQAVVAKNSCWPAGHDHIGGYASQGHVHYLTVEAVLEGGQPRACAAAGCC